MSVLDTDFLVSLLRGDQEAVRTSKDIREPKTTIINVFELYYGAEKAGNPEKALKEVNALIDAMDVLPLDKNACQKSANIQASLDSKGEPIGILDNLIAGVVIASRETLLTHNTKHFSRIADLKIESW
jgi:predicted nucleic acid-binding protein